MRNKPIWKLLAISFALVMVVSCLPVDNNSTNSASRKLDTKVFKVRPVKSLKSLKIL